MCYKANGFERDNQTPDWSILIWRKHTVSLIKIKMKSNKSNRHTHKQNRPVDSIFGVNQVNDSTKREYKHNFNDQKHEKKRYTRKKREREKEIFMPATDDEPQGILMSIVYICLICVKNLSNFWWIPFEWFHPFWLFEDFLRYEHKNGRNIKFD